MFRDKIFSAVVISMALFSCAHEKNLRPTSQAGVSPDSIPESDVSRVEGVRIMVASGLWVRRDAIKAGVTPLRVKIRNESGRPLLIRYRDFSLVNSSGRRYAAIPPRGIEGTTPELDIAPARSPRFRASKFEIAPYYAYYYPTVPRFPGNLRYDPEYQNWYQKHWRRAALPTPKMLAHALPEGVLQNGGQITGFLYFEQIFGNERRVTFFADLADARHGNYFGTVFIPITVE